LHRVSRRGFYGFRLLLSRTFCIICKFFSGFSRNRGRSLFGNRSRGIKHDGFLGSFMLHRTHIGEGQRGDEKDSSCRAGQLGQKSTGPTASKQRGTSASKNDPHAFLAGLQKYQNYQNNTCDNMNGDNQRIQGLDLLTYRARPAWAFNCPRQTSWGYMFNRARSQHTLQTKNTSFQMIMPTQSG